MKRLFLLIASMAIITLHASEGREASLENGSYLFESNDTAKAILKDAEEGRAV